MSIIRIVDPFTVDPAAIVSEPVNGARLPTTVIRSPHAGLVFPVIWNLFTNI